jgi:hypothetical protein
VLVALALLQCESESLYCSRWYHPCTAPHPSKSVSTCMPSSLRCYVHSFPVFVCLCCPCACVVLLFSAVITECLLQTADVCCLLVVCGGLWAWLLVLGLFGRASLYCMFAFFWGGGLGCVLLVLVPPAGSTIIDICYCQSQLVGLDCCWWQAHMVVCRLHPALDPLAARTSGACVSLLLVSLLTFSLRDIDITHIQAAAT